MSCVASDSSMTSDLSDLGRRDDRCERQTVADALCHGHDVRHEALQAVRYDEPMLVAVVL